jgi:5-methylcytosine-specific restriction endonuclease McrA
MNVVGTGVRTLSPADTDGLPTTFNYLSGCQMKYCPKCQTETERTASRNSCKQCIKLQSAAWVKANPERSKARAAAWRKANPERAKATAAAWYEANPEKTKAYAAAWAKANAERKKANTAAWRKANTEKTKATRASWQKANLEVCRISNQNRDASKRANGGKLSQGLSAKLFILQKGKCPCCSKPLGDDYHLDHIIPIKLGGENIDSNIQLLRATCNMQKNAKHPIDFMQQRGFLL